MLGTVFEITSYTESTAGCDREGPSSMDQLDGETFLYLYEAESFGSQITSTITCLSPDECRTKAQAWKSEQRPPASRAVFYFHRSTGRNQREGIWRTTGMAGFEQGKCQSAESGSSTMELTGNALRVELRAARADLPADEQGSCSTAATEKALEGKPCSVRRVLRARAHSPL